MPNGLLKRLNRMRQFLRDIRSQKLRAILTLFGIVWGTVNVVSLLAFGEGLQQQTLKNMHSMGEKITLIFSGGRTSKPFLGYNKGRMILLEEDDIRLLKEQIGEISLISPEYSLDAELKYEKNVYNASIHGIHPDFSELRNIFSEKGGRFINSLDFSQGKRVIFIGDTIKKTLFNDKEAVGKTITLNGMPFIVIGHMKGKTQNMSYGSFESKSAFLPSSTFSFIFGTKQVHNIVYKLQDPRLSKSVQSRIYQVLGKKYKFDPTDKQALFVWDTSEIDEFLMIFLFAIKIFLGLIGSFALMVGGIGVASIMNVVVEERVKEIGIKIAVGAKRSYIMSQFIIETLLITFIGGIIGIVIAYGIISIFPLFKLGEYVGDPVLSLPIGVIVILLLGIIGFIAGLFPARRAVRLNPVEALRL